MFQVLNGAVHAVRVKQAAGATFFPARAKHEVIDNQPAATWKRSTSVSLPFLFPKTYFFSTFSQGRSRRLPAQLIAHMGEFLFLAEKFLSRRNPFL